ncbi:hypothetical protein [Nocardia sp. XZ_19_369]|uniref:hypothetical protein n=1 Tax=Nocardia sp. XZ_19_369 TaxID=2769487 RepID=UPI00188FEC2E|nr:hypothetical protein [Nocardia sp. XZ_19_369]
MNDNDFCAIGDRARGGELIDHVVTVEHISDTQRRGMERAVGLPRDRLDSGPDGTILLTARPDSCASAAGLATAIAYLDAQKLTYTQLARWRFTHTTSRPQELLSVEAGLARVRATVTTVLDRLDTRQRLEFELLLPVQQILGWTDTDTLSLRRTPPCVSLGEDAVHRALAQVQAAVAEVHSHVTDSEQLRRRMLHEGLLPVDSASPQERTDRLCEQRTESLMCGDTV